MTLCRHIRRPDPSPLRGNWLIACDCGWTGTVPDLGRSREQIGDALNRIFVDHLPKGESRTYLLVDTQEPRSNLTIGQITDAMAEAGEKLDAAEAARRFEAQPKIIGTFVMPVGEPVVLLGERKAAGVHYGRFTVDGREHELPIGEVRTADSRVFRLDE